MAEGADYRPHLLGRGVTRSVYRVGRWAVKVPRLNYLVRGWLANQSEWFQRDRPEVARPVFSFAHLALVMPMAEYTREDEIPRDEGFEAEWDARVRIAGRRGYDGDEAKPSSWGWFRDLNDSPLGGYRLIDFDRAWDPEQRSLIGRIYYWNQERLGRKWSALSGASGGADG